MKMMRILSTNGMLVSIFLLITCIANAQKLSYSDVPITDKYFDIRYTIGYQNHNVVVWFYEISEKALHLNIFNGEMRLIKDVSIKIDKLDNFYQINFLKKDYCYDIGLHYLSDKGVLTQIFSYNSTKSTIEPLQILETTDAKGELTIKNSSNGKFIGFIKQYKTVDDSILIHYSVYNNQYELVNNFAFILPQIHSSVNFSNSLVDNSGNLFFSAVSNANKTIKEEEVTIYEVNLKKDSLLTNNFFRNGTFSNVHIQENSANEGLAVSGLWSDDLENELQNKYFFLMQLNENISQEGELTLFSIKKIADSICSAKFLVNSVNFILTNDSGFHFYLSGITNVKTKKVLKSLPANSQTGPDLSAINSTMHSFYDGRATPSDLQFRAANNVPNVYTASNHSDLGSYNTPLPNSGNYFANNNSDPYRIRTSGNNFFISLLVNKKGIISIHNFKDKDIDKSSSFPESEFVANTNNNMHYLYSRTIKKNKQLIFDLVCERDGKMYVKPIVANTKQTLSLNRGIQISSNVIVFPIMDEKFDLSLAKMDLE